MLPYHPKRHLIRESPSFVEVNTTTNKIKHPVHIVLMNDTILIATRKKKSAAHSKYKLLGDRCWPLTEITIEDQKDTAGKDRGAGGLENHLSIARSKTNSCGLVSVT